MRCIAAALTAAMVSATTALAALPPLPMENKFQQMAGGEKKQSAGMELGAGMIEEDLFLKLVLSTELNFGMVGVGLQIPLNLRVWDRDPKKSDEDYYGLVRRQDWDEPSEYLQVLRYLRVGNKRDTVFLQVGQLTADLGHGTIMNRYMNSLDINTRRIGLQLDINTKYGGFESVVNDVVTLAHSSASSESSIVGGRVYFKPLSLMDADSLLNIFSVGFSVVADRNAPYVLAIDSTTNKPIIDEAGNYEVAQAKALVVYGVDVEAEVLHTAMLDLIPYSDFNFITDAGWGWHAGTLATFKMPVGIALTVPLRLEYRRFRSDYVPGYFSSFVEQERHVYNDLMGHTDLPDSHKTKHYVVRNAASGEGYNGVYGDMGFDLAGLVQFGAIYEDSQMTDPRLAAYLNVPALEVVQFKAYYERNQVQGWGDILGLDDRSVAAAQGRYQIMPMLYVAAQWMRQWAADPDAPGQYRARDSWDFGVGASLAF